MYSKTIAVINLVETALSLSLSLSQLQPEERADSEH